MSQENVREDIIAKLFDGLFSTSLRRLDIGEQLKQRGLRVAHIHPVNDPSDPFAVTHHTTIVYRPRFQNTHTLEFAAAVCSPQDTFSKKVGLHKALARWNAGQTSLLPPRRAPLSDHQLLESYFA